MSWLSKLKQGLSKTAALFSFGGAGLKNLDDVEEALLKADVGYGTTTEIMDAVRREKPKDEAAFRQVVRDVMIRKITPIAKPMMPDTTHKPAIILMIGVNGAGKTTTIGKLGSIYQARGLKVAFVAADTFRAGATEQLCRWGEKLNVPTYTAGAGADAAGLVFDAVQKSQKDGTDILFIDTAGRLQNRSDLMEELKKITRVIKKLDPEAPQETVLVLDATVGQNAISQVKTFREMAGVTGLIMTKLDGTAKGGILVALADQFKLPVYALGVGEKIDDLRPFTADEYVTSLLGDS
ncbi:MAG: signal recognition particle-docking protein FtsY [Alphaproteobacteria bacterium]|nr:signal recognition particle-docking protein FtsY [Alphaproteobacteria bacterium]